MRHARNTFIFPALLVGLALGGAALFAAFSRPGPTARAIAPCLSHANTAEETQFIGLLQAWRDANISGSYSLTVSQPLNDAAAGYAQFLANKPGAAGHYADGSNWAARAVQCGYPSSIAAGGEGLAVVESSAPVGLDPQGALNIMTAEAGGGVHVPSNVGAPVKCVGAAKMVSADGKKVAWVTLIFATFTTCPAGSPPVSSPTPTNTSTNTATATSTPTATPTATASPTPPAQYGVTLNLVPNGWVLVTLPAGDIAAVMARAAGCYAAVYVPGGDGWLRYAPGIPGWASNLSTLTGPTPAWILGSGQSCPPVTL